MDPDWFDAKFSPTTTLRVQVKERLLATRSQFQKIEVFESFDFGRVLALDDVINVTARDEFIYHEMLAHPALFTHPDPRRACVVGGGDGGVIREIMRHASIDEALLVEIDEQVVDVSRTYLPAVSCGLADPRVRIQYEDASKFMAGCRGCFDVIAVDSTDPFGPGERLFTPEFYRNCFTALTANGILTAQSESPFFDPQIVARLYAGARSVFEHVWMYTAFMPSYVSGLWSFMFCSKGLDPRADFRPAADGFSTGYYSAEMHAAAFALPPCIKNEFSLP